MYAAFLFVPYYFPAGITIFAPVAAPDEVLAANHTPCRIFWFCKQDIQFLIQRQDCGFEPFADNMRIGDRLGAYAV